VSSLENSEYSLTDIDDRLFALKAQARKHACGIDDLPAKRDEIALLLRGIEDQEDTLADLQKAVKMDVKNTPRRPPIFRPDARKRRRNWTSWSARNSRR